MIAKANVFQSGKSMKRMTQAVCLLFMGILNSMLWLINVLVLKKEKRHSQIGRKSKWITLAACIYTCEVESACLSVLLNTTLGE